ncbi:energy transducer TonB [Helicobacter jaachi]|uniref:Energy transducer TonB n=1 Tax=Helicobacter jaachi TaxID=1677920 RepID=A0A4U8TBK7_9HELI|nr:energy transducer TonB [Helicobacter jaachi]TLD97291.1 energy transducer TonB [Helicobacter jaachi]
MKWAFGFGFSIMLHGVFVAWILYKKPAQDIDTGGMSGEIAQSFASVMTFTTLPIGELKKQTTESAVSAVSASKSIKTPQALAKESLTQSNIALRADKKINIKQEQKSQVKPTNAQVAQDVDSKTQDTSLSAPKASTQDKVTSPVSGDSQNIIETYQGLLAAHISKYKQYPNASILANEEGTSVVAIRIDENGNVLFVALRKSSGYGALDSESVALFKRASPLPKPPNDLLNGKSVLSFTLPVYFVINKSANKGL